MNQEGGGAQKGEMKVGMLQGQPRASSDLKWHTLSVPQPHSHHQDHRPSLEVFGKWVGCGPWTWGSG
jgi:hypothetical protein